MDARLAHHGHHPRAHLTAPPIRTQPRPNFLELLQRGKLSLPVLPVERIDEKRTAIDQLLNRPAAARSGCIQLPSDRRCPRSFGNQQSYALSALMSAHVLGARVQASTAMDCNSLLRFKVDPQRMVGPLVGRRRLRRVVNVPVAELCQRLGQPSYGLNRDECLGLDGLDHGQMLALMLASCNKAPSDLFALGPHAALGSIFDASFSLRNESAADVPTWRDDEIRISVHVRHFEADDDGHDPQSLQAYEDAVRVAAAAASKCALLVASDRRLTLQLMEAVAQRVGCRMLVAARGPPVTDFSAEHGEDVGEVVLRDVFLLAQGQVLVGTWGSTLTIIVQQLIAARSTGHPHAPTVSYCDPSQSRCLPPLPLLASSPADAWWIVFEYGVPRLVKPHQARKALANVLKAHHSWPTMDQTVDTLRQLDVPVVSSVELLASAAIISMSASSARFWTVADTLASCGFEPVHVQAASPKHYGSMRELLLELFGTRKAQRMTRMSAFEVGLLVSHKRALEAIARSGYAWGAVFEDDACLADVVRPLQVKRLLHRAFAAATAASGRIVLYLGSCNPQCEADQGSARHPSGLPAGLLRVGRCHAFCTHAYALSRHHAATFFADVFGCHSGECGSMCRTRPCFMDWAMSRYFLAGDEHNDSAWVVAGGLRSRWASDHRGVFVQNRSAALGNNVSGTGLHLAHPWPKGKEVLKAALLRQREWQRGFARGDAMGRGREPLQKLLVTSVWSGRAGNLLFEWAALVGVAAQLRAIVPATEAVYLRPPSSSDVPVKAFLEQFDLSSTMRVIPNASASFASVFASQLEAGVACRVDAQESWPHSHDDDLLRGLAAWARSPPQGCHLGLVELSGYFQSFRYFSGEKRKRSIQKALDPSSSAASTQREAEAILASARGRLGATRRREVVGVQVRLGDKVNSAIYSSIYAATDWEYYRRAMREMARTLEATGVSVAFIVTAGGSSEGNAADVAEARQHLSDAGPRVFFSTAEDPYVDLAVLRRCNALVIGPSTLGWWAAYLADLPTARVIAPEHIYQGLRWQKKMGFHEGDYYPTGWLLLANNGTGPSRHPQQPTVASPRGPPRWLECQLRIVGQCGRVSSLPRYRNWFVVWGAPPAAAAQGCEVRRRAWARTCTLTGGVEKRLMRNDSTPAERAAATHTLSRLERTNEPSQVTQVLRRDLWRRRSLARGRGAQRPRHLPKSVSARVR